MQLQAKICQLQVTLCDDAGNPTGTSLLTFARPVVLQVAGDQAQIVEAAECADAELKETVAAPEPQVPLAFQDMPFPQLPVLAKDPVRPGRPRRVFDSERAIKLRGCGWSYASIGMALGVAPGVVARRLRGNLASTLPNAATQWYTVPAGL